MIVHLSKNLLLVSILLLIFNLGTTSVAKAQVVLYMEIMGQEKPIKYYEGQSLSYKSAEFPDEWQDIRIERVVDDEKLILYNGGMLKLDDIIEIRRSRAWANTVGYMLQTFGTAWLAFGGVIHFTDSNFSFGLDTLAIGGTALGTGWLIRKLFRYKEYKIGRRYRLKILDLSWPDPYEVNRGQAVKN